MKTKKVMTVMLLSILSACLVCGLTACGGTSNSDKSSGGKSFNSDESSKSESTVVGSWSYIDESQPWTLGFTEDGDFYDSRGILMYVKEDVFSNYTNYGSWRIRADGRIWFTGTLELNRTIREYSWAYLYELDGDTMTIDKYTFKRVK